MIDVVLVIECCCMFCGLPCVVSCLVFVVSCFGCSLLFGVRCLLYMCVRCFRVLSVVCFLIFV